ncbi:MAG: PorT family protein [Clostridium sp.]|nr:PorT family protein [Clostridium sp.]
MRKKLIPLVAAIVATTVTLSAQTPFDSGNNHPHWGARIGLDVSHPGDLSVDKVSIDMFNAGAGFSFGAVYNMPLVANLYLEPGALFYYDTFGTDVQILDGPPEQPGPKLGFKQFGLRIPVMVGYHVDLAPCSIHLFLGPEFSIGLHGRATASYKSGSTNISESENCYEDGGLKRFNAAFRFGAAVEVGHYYLSLSESIGSNMLRDWGNDVSCGHRLFNLSLGYNF